MKLLKLLTKQISGLKLLSLTLLLALSTGCANSPVTVYPIRDTDISVTDDQVIMSKWYFKEVLQVKLEEGR